MENSQNFNVPSTSLGTPRAVIDIGTNSVKLLVAKVDGAEVIPLAEDSKQTRLGQGFYETHLLQAEAILTTAEAVLKFAEQARSLGAENICVIATSAARDALNPSDLLRAIREKTGLSVEIISGEQEADWVFQGVSSDPRFSEMPLLITDVGGGSTEFILGKGQQQFFRNSYRLGTVRLLEQLHPSDPPGAQALSQCRDWLNNFIETQIAPSWADQLQKAEGEIQLVGTGGTTSILARMEKHLAEFDREQIEATSISFQKIQAQVERVWNLPLEERKKIVGLPPKRADVIIMGLAIYEAIMRRFGFRELRISTRGLRYAAVSRANF
jgi:exopolyphosphatase/guanosine-5'-triphosphate,3'-diphosphate pyrophosphatase